MKEVGEEKIGESDEELEIESEEKARGEKIEIDEDRLPSRAMAIHEHIRQDGEKEMERDAMASSGQLSPQGSQWAHLCSPKGYFMFSWKVCRAVFTRESRLYLRLCDCHHGPPAAVYRKHGDRRSAGDAKPYPRQFRFIDASVERRPAG
jgi:hypothetical protein